MAKVKQFGWVGVAPLLVALLSDPAAGQQAGTNDPANVAGRTALENVAGGAVGLRSPGNMVQAGVARTVDHIVLGRIGYRDITETEASRPTSPRAQFLSDALEAVFEQLNLAIQYFENLLRVRAGLPPEIPGDIPDLPMNGDGGTSDGDSVDGDPELIGINGDLPDS